MSSKIAERFYILAFAATGFVAQFYEGDWRVLNWLCFGVIILVIGAFRWEEQVAAARARRDKSY